MAGRAMVLGQEARVLVTRVACSHLGRHVIGGRALSDVRLNDGFHKVGVLRLGHRFKSYSRHRMSLDVLRVVRPQPPTAAHDYRDERNGSSPSTAPNVPPAHIKPMNMTSSHSSASAK